MKIYDIYVAYVSWGSVGKRRPVLILHHGSSGITVFGITTRYDCKSESIRSRFFKISDWSNAGLNQESYIDTNRTLTLPRSSVDEPIGKLTESDVQRLVEFLSV